MGLIAFGLLLGKIGTQLHFVSKKNASYERFEALFPFDTIEEKDGIVYSAYEVTLYPVPEGTAQTEEVPKENFPRPK